MDHQAHGIMDDVLSQIYDSKVLGEESGACFNMHLVFESTRRYLDITRYINRRWPYTMRYLSAIYGENVLESVFDKFHEKGKTYKNLNDAACSVFFKLVASGSADIQVEMLLYEDFRNGRGGKYHYQSQKPKGDFKVIPYDLESIYMTLMFYGRASAPLKLYRQLNLEQGITYREKLC